ncbi:MAG: rRNA pseudouridine synthase [Herbaspirillum sp.]
MVETVRLAKRLAAAIPCSHGEAERYIAGGWVLVDGVIAEEPGLRVLPQQQVELLPNASAQALEPATFLLHKPADVVAELGVLLPLLDTTTRALDDHTRIRFLKRHLAHLELLAPPQEHASGLVVLTQDWRVARKLGAELNRIEQEYVVDVQGDLVPDGLTLLNHGLHWNGKPVASVKVSWQNETRLRFALKAPQPGQIAGMCQQVGLRVSALKRIRIGRVPMAVLPCGQWKYLAGYQRF